VRIDELAEEEPPAEEVVAFGGYVGTAMMEYYRFIGACRYLRNGECGIYEDRPSACRNFEVGSEDCRKIRFDEID